MGAWGYGGPAAWLGWRADRPMGQKCLNGMFTILISDFLSTRLCFVYNLVLTHVSVSEFGI